MKPLSGSFAGKITKQTALSLTDQPGHQLGVAEVSGTQLSPDPQWNNSKITYWGVTDVVNGNGHQRGYYDNAHSDGRDWGTFEAKVTTANGVMSLDGTFKITGGDGQYKGITGNGKFKTKLKSETELECAWEGQYEIAKAAQGR